MEKKRDGMKKMERRTEGKESMSVRAARYGANSGQDMELGTCEVGIPSWDSPEPNDEPLTPLKNRFSALHDVSEDEAYRVVRGSTTSANIKPGGY